MFGLSGRTVNRMAKFNIYPNNYFIGIKSPGYYFGTNENINFKAIAVDHNDNFAQNLAGNVKLVKLEWKTVLKKNNAGKYVYASEKKEVPVWEKEMDLSDGEKNIPVMATQNGEYELRISQKGNEYYQAAKFYAQVA